MMNAFAAGAIQVFRVPPWARREFGLSPKWGAVFLALFLSFAQFLLNLL